MDATRKVLTADAAFAKFLFSVTNTQVQADRRPKLSAPELWMLWNLEDAGGSYLQWRLRQGNTNDRESA